MIGFRVIKPGLLSLFQDDGRLGHQREGIPIGGAMDLENLYKANALVGKPLNSAALEVTYLGPELIFEKSMSISITGALLPKINGNRVASFKTHHVKKNDVLSFEIPNVGFRSYIGFSDELCLSTAFGSTSTYLKASLGGYNGRSLSTGDQIEVKPVDFNETFFLHDREKSYNIRVIKGYECDIFSNLNDLFNKTYTITDEIDRMGMRLMGEKLICDSSDIISSPVIPGTIQVPSNGQPIIMLRDAQTIGGYTRVGCVISTDLDQLAQLKPGDTLKFVPITQEESAVIKKEWYKKVSLMTEQMKKEKKYFSISLNQNKYQVSVEEI